MGKLRVKDNKKSQDKVVKQELQPLSKLCFGFQYVTSNNNFCFKQLDSSEKIIAYDKFLSRLNELSQINAAEAHNLGKIRGMEKIPYSQLHKNMQQICDGTGIITKDSKIVVFRFNNQKYRLICKDDIMHPNLMHVIAFDFNYSAYDHGN
jgi:hypothetical protein